MNIRKSLLISGVVLALTGCADFQQRWDAMTAPTAPTTPSGQPVATEPDIVSVKLAQAADKASRALDNISNIEQQRNPAVPAIPDDYANASPNMMQPVSIRWSGPIEQIARVLAERAGLRFRVKGREPAVPLVVNVDAYQQPILHVLRDVGLQAGNRADLSIDQNEGVVEVRYAANDQSR
ncbi:MAG: DotD/TraH family lipoprotein [Alphaproteobacteria bacterium]|nr:DotD/TraH family lipoprotein [Alphaproteobacteria bacterium]